MPKPPPLRGDLILSSCIMVAYRSKRLYFSWGGGLLIYDELIVLYTVFAGKLFLVIMVLGVLNLKGSV
jgi:hypothetical protein